MCGIARVAGNGRVLAGGNYVNCRAFFLPVAVEAPASQFTRLLAAASVNTANMPLLSTVTDMQLDIQAFCLCIYLCPSQHGQ